MPAALFDEITAPAPDRVASGLAKIAMSLKSSAWKGAQPHGVSPTQAQILSLLKGAPGGLRPGEIAERLAITAATVSEMVKTLIGKGLAERAVDPSDKRASRILATEDGLRIADRTSEWPDALVSAIHMLDGQEQAVMLKALSKMIRTLQQTGSIPVQSMCVTCRHFRPFAHGDAELPHHCAFIDAPFGDRHLRLDCPEQVPAAPDAEAAAWNIFTSGAAH